MNNVKDNIKDIVRKDIFYQANNDVVLFSKRLENINIAIYMITDFMSDQEPLKMSLREKSIQLMSHIMSLINEPNYFRKESVPKIDSLVLEIISLLKVAFVSKMISEMNYNILVDGCNKFLYFMRESFSDNQKNILDENFFKEEKIVGIKSKEQIYKGHFIKDKKDIKDKSITTTAIKDKTNSIRQRVVSIKDTDKLNNRRKSIINIIKKQKKVSVKDLSKIITNCSEKTLQRELINMVNENVLKKEGERRWSKYLLKN